MSLLRWQEHFKIGEVLLRRGLINEQQLAEALRSQDRWGSRLGDIVMAKGWVKARDFYQALADHLGLSYIDLLDQPPDQSLFSPADLDQYSSLLVLPWRRVRDMTWVVAADPSPEVWEFVTARFGGHTRLAQTSKFDIIWELQRYGDAQFTDNAVTALARRTPEHSASTVFTPPQLATIYVALSIVLLLLTLFPSRTLLLLNAAICVILLLNFGLRMLLAWVGADRCIDVKVTKEEVDALEDSDLPAYTVLVPMYKEPDVLPILASALRRMDYPLSKLDIKLVLESNDQETIQAAKNLGLEANFEIIRVPPSQPKTKPKACNYALHFARGEFLTIYDAEDKPEPDQLKKAVVTFRKSPPNTACVQARLNYFNADENWLTRMFTLEYSLWFDYYLPALETLRIPIPLGGTSNHFRMDVLRKIGAWDPFNVTEDADLGVRLTQMNYQVAVVNSTTYEEANRSVGNWIRQRSRWLKGYMQTYLVHMRHPLDLYRSLGPVGFWGFQFFVGGNCLNALFFPVLLSLYVVWLLTGTRMFDAIFPPALLYISLFNLLVGNGCFVFLSLLAAFKRGLYGLVPYAFTVPAYWCLQSLAGYKALWQLVHNPFFWEKTTHGISRFTASELERAAEKVA